MQLKFIMQYLQNNQKEKDDTKVNKDLNNSKENLVQILAVPLARCVTLGKFLNLPQSVSTSIK